MNTATVQLSTSRTAPRRREALGILAHEHREHRDAEADVPLLVERDVAHAGAETRQLVAVDEVALDEMLAGLGERPLL